MEQIRASVAMAVYNGEKYLREQLDSILHQLGPEDELVISYDPSDDNTLELIKTYAGIDSRVKLLTNPNPGRQNNFTNAVMACRGKYIFFSDQDDVWFPDKVETVLSRFKETGADLVVHDGIFADASLNPTGTTVYGGYGTYNNPILNTVRSNLWGCCMAFRGEFGKSLCPFPTDLGHDLWLGLLAGFHGKIARVDRCLIYHRLHESNATPPRRSLPVILAHRVRILFRLGSWEFKRIFRRKGK